jgi:hypothetical protein
MTLGDDFPTLPTIASLQWEPPAKGTLDVRGTSTDRLKINWIGKPNDYFDDIPSASTSPGPPGYLLDRYTDGQPASNYTLTMRSYFIPVPGSYTRVFEGGSVNRTYTTTYGITTTDSTTLSAELGVDADSLSAKISESFTHTVETSSSTTKSVTYNIGAPEPGFTRVWMMWQLVDEIVALGADGNIIPNPERVGVIVPRGPPYPPLDIPIPLQYTNLDQAFPSQTFVPAQQDFPNDDLSTRRGHGTRDAVELAD